MLRADINHERLLIQPEPQETAATEATLPGSQVHTSLVMLGPVPLAEAQHSVGRGRRVFGWGLTQLAQGAERLSVGFFVTWAAT